MTEPEAKTIRIMERAKMEWSFTFHFYWTRRDSDTNKSQCLIITHADSFDSANDAWYQECGVRIEDCSYFSSSCVRVFDNELE